jgi:hypothetical protein
MKTKISYLTILFICLLTFFVASCGVGTGTKDRPTISDAERALAMLQIQNAFSKHAFYHINGNHCEEMDDVWVKEGGAYDKTAHWGQQEGIAVIKKAYCIDNLENKKKDLTAISKVSDIKDVPENLGAGHEFSLHMQTTPVIEIAGDGRTAKGIWYTPGFIKRVNIEDGKISESGMWMFERYAVDFAKEDGKWKIWHFQNLGDTSPPWGANNQTGQPSQTDQKLFGDAANLAEKQADAGTPKVWSPTTVPEMYPKFPEPYYTFSETFSY